MRLTYDPAPQPAATNRVSKRSLKLTALSIGGLTTCIVCGVLLYASFKPQQITTVYETPAYLAAPAQDIKGVELQEDTSKDAQMLSSIQIQDKDYVNIESAHDYTNFEYLIKEIGDNLAEPKK